MGIDELVKEAAKLSTQDRKRLLEELERSLNEETSVPGAPASAGPYARTLALAGTFHSDHTDVSTNKYEHLGEIYADDHEDP